MNQFGFSPVWVSAALAVTFATQSAYAAPTAFPSGGWSLVGVVNHTNSTIIADSEDPRFVWVMPPTAGSISAGGLQGANANVGFCRNLLGLRTSGEVLIKELDAVNKQVSGALVDIKRKQAEFEMLHKAAEGIRTSSSVLQQVQSLEDELVAVNKRLQDDYARLETCKGDACAAIQADIADSRRLRTNTQERLASLRSQAGDDLRRYNRAKGLADAAQENLSRSLDYLKLVRNNLLEGHEQLMRMYGNYAKLEAGFSTLTYRTGWDDNVQQLSRDNPGYHFQQIQTQDARVNVNLLATQGGADEYLSSFPAILGYTVNGKGYLPYGNSTPEGSTQVIDAVPDVMGASLRLSLVGGCPVLHPEKYDLSKDQTGIPLFSISATYRYPLQYRTRVQFSYNLYKFYEQIKRSGTRGGFFSTSSWSENFENKSDKEAFEANWEESDPSNVLSSEQKRVIEKEVKAELMERVLKQMATPLFDGRANFALAPPVPESGAVVLARGLDQTCGWYSYYCTGGSWLLRGLGAIFGSTEMESRFKSNYNATATETWSQNTVRLKDGVMVFVGDNR